MTKAVRPLCHRGSMKGWRYVAIATALIVAFLLGVGVGFHLAAPGQTSIPSEEFTQYSLFTWKSRSHGLCFALMLQYKSGNFIHGWTSKWGQKCGIDQLKQSLSTLPKDTYVYWNTWPPKNCDYPEKTVVRDVIASAASKGVHVELLPVLQ